MSLVTISETNMGKLPLLGRGKVRDIYGLDNKLLVISTDRLSAFDVVLPDPIPKKGLVLNQLSIFWMNKTRNIAPNHLISANVEEYPAELLQYSDQLKDRSMLVRKADVFPVECIARGYIIGSGWSEYKATGSICGIRLPSGLNQGQKLPEPM
ncbi:MAG: phosphoribosylaminoimidazolesuccinocarboxamide synthase, partial [Pseudomonadota bacterium]